MSHLQGLENMRSQIGCVRFSRKLFDDVGQQVKLGADASAAAGPKGRTAEGATDIVMNAEILSYSRNKGLFAGISLEGSTLRSDGSANEKLYGRRLSATDIIRGGKVWIPQSAK